MSPTKPRITPLEADEMTEEQFAIGGGRDNPFCHLNFYRTMVRHPTLLAKFIPFSMQLGQRSQLPPREQEIIILYTSAKAGDVYENAHHDIIARRRGLSEEEIKAAREGGEGLSSFEKTLIKAADEIMSGYCMSDETWSELAKTYSEQQMIEVLFTVAQYTLMAMVMNSLGVQVEENVANSWKPTA